jgi:Tol biopolymer transport system component
MKRIGRVILMMISVTALMSLGIPTALAAVPTITSFSPTSGPLGTVVTMTGTNFTNPVVTSVTFPTAANASFTVVSDTEIQATVPTAASGSGPISVTSPGGTATSATAFTITGASNGRIAFTSEDGPDTDIFTIKPDGTGLLNVTPDDSSYDNYPSWSPDGSKIAFGSGRDGDPEIYVMNADGTGMQRLTTSPGRDIHPSWSPDGTKIVFASDRTGDLELFTMNADGTDEQQLTFDPGTHAWPKYSPDGTQIAYSELQATWAVYTIPANGGTPTKLTPDNLNAAEPDWSPDGTRFVFVNNYLTALPSSIFTMKTDSTDIVQLTQNPNESELNPNWSPDGTKIDFWTVVVFPAAEQAFDFGFQGSSRILSAMMNGDIFAMNADGSSRTDITNSPGRGDRHPDWGTNLA